MSGSPPPERQTTLEDKVKAFELLERGWNQQQVADKLNTSQGTISRWVKNSAAIKHGAAANAGGHRLTTTRFSELNEAVVAYVDARTKATDGRPRGLSWALIQRFAKQAGKDQYARFSASNNWLQRLMKRHAIVRRSLAGQ